MKIVLYSINIVSALLMVGVILLQQGKGAELGSGFGRGSSGSLFGARGSANFLTRMTSVLATVFFLSAFMLTFIANKRSDSEIIDEIEQGSRPAVISGEQVPGSTNSERIPE